MNQVDVASNGGWRRDVWSNSVIYEAMIQFLRLCLCVCFFSSFFLDALLHPPQNPRIEPHLHFLSCNSRWCHLATNRLASRKWHDAVGMFSHNSLNGWKKKKKKPMRISRTNTPTLSSVIVSLEKGEKKTKQNTSPQRTNASNWAKSCALLLTPTPPSTWTPSPSTSSVSLSHLVLGDYRSQIFICGEKQIHTHTHTHTFLCQAAGNVCICMWSIGYKVHADLQRVMLDVCIYNSAVARQAASRIW